MIAGVTVAAEVVDSAKLLAGLSINIWRAVGHDGLRRLRIRRQLAVVLRYLRTCGTRV